MIDANARYKADAANHLNQRRINTGRVSAQSVTSSRLTAMLAEEPPPLPEMPPDPMLTTKQAAMILGVSVETLKKWRRKGTGPQFLRYPDGAIRYRLSVIMGFLEISTVEPHTPHKAARTSRSNPNSFPEITLNREYQRAKRPAQKGLMDRKT